MTRARVIGDLIVAYLRRVRGARPVDRIILHMYRAHKINPAATRSHLSALVKNGLVTRIERGVYRANIE